MNLYKLRLQHEEKQTILKSKMERLQEINEKMKSIQSPQFSHTKTTRTNNKDKYLRLVAKKVELENDIDLLMEDIKADEKLINEIEKLLNKYNDTEKKIYFEYYFKRYSADKISQRHHYSRAQIYRIIKKMDEEFMRQNETECIVKYL